MCIENYCMWKIYLFVYTAYYYYSGRLYSFKCSDSILHLIWLTCMPIFNQCFQYYQFEMGLIGAFLNIQSLQITKFIDYKFHSADKRSFHIKNLLISVLFSYDSNAIKNGSIVYPIASLFSMWGTKIPFSCECDWWIVNALQWCSIFVKLVNELAGPMQWIHWYHCQVLNNSALPMLAHWNVCQEKRWIGGFNANIVFVIVNWTNLNCPLF